MFLADALWLCECVAFSLMFTMSMYVCSCMNAMGSFTKKTNIVILIKLILTFRNVANDTCKRGNSYLHFYNKFDKFFKLRKKN